MKKVWPRFFTFTKTGAQWRQCNKQGIYADSENICALKSAKVKFYDQLSDNFYRIFFQGIFITRYSSCNLITAPLPGIQIVFVCRSLIQSISGHISVYYGNKVIILTLFVFIYLFFCYLHSELSGPQSISCLCRAASWCVYPVSIMSFVAFLGGLVWSIYPLVLFLFNTNTGEGHV